MMHLEIESFKNEMMYDTDSLTTLLIFYVETREIIDTVPCNQRLKYIKISSLFEDIDFFPKNFTSF